MKTAKKARTPRQTARGTKPKSKKQRKALDPARDFSKPVKRTPRQGRLPGTEDPAIQELETLAEQHSDLLGEIRTQRNELKDLQKKLAVTMRRLGRTTYNHAGVVLKLREGKDSVSVKVKRHDPDEAPAVEEDTPPALGDADDEAAAAAGI